MKRILCVLATVIASCFLDISTAGAMMQRFGACVEANGIVRRGFLGGELFTFSFPIEIGLFLSSALIVLAIRRFYVENRAIRALNYIVASQPFWYGALANSAFIISRGAMAF